MNAFLPPDASAYLEALRWELADLPADERDDLLADVETSLAEAVADGEDLAVRLGPPGQFAAELRAAAGLRQPREEVGALESLRRLLAAPRTRAATRALSRLAPVWWVVRAYVAVGAIVLAAGGAWSLSHPGMPHVVDGRGGLAAIAIAVVVSVALGLRGARSREARRAGIAVNLALLVAAVPVLRHVWNGARLPGPQIVEVVSSPAGGLTYDGSPVLNVYPYSRDGRMLHDVLLYDENGNALEVGGPAAPDPNRRLLVTARGAQLFNSFPIRYFDPGTRRVAHPNAGPRVRTPELLTPPLRSAQARAASAKRSRASGRRSKGAPPRSSG